MKSFYELQDEANGVKSDVYYYKATHEFRISWRVLLMTSIWSRSPSDITEGNTIVPTWAVSISNIK